MKKETSIMKMTRDEAPNDRKITKFPSGLFEYTPYDNTQFSEVTRKVCSSGIVTSVNSFRLSKVIILGDLSVGKTSIVNRFCRKFFDTTYKATIGVDFEVERFDVLKVPFSLQIWDTAGQERFKSIAQSYYRAAHAIFVVFDLSHSQSLMNTEKWLNEALNASGTSCPYRFLVGTKSDLLSKHALKNMCQSASRVAKRLKAELWIVSSKTGENINELFFRTVALTFDNCMCQEIEKSQRIHIGYDNSLSFKSNMKRDNDEQRFKCGSKCQ